MFPGFFREIFLLQTVLLPFTLCLSPVFAAEGLTVSAQVSKTVVKPDEALIFSIVITGLGQGMPQLQLGSLEGFKVVSTGQSQQIQIQAGKTRRALVFNYTLVPASPGSYRIGPVTVEFEGKQYQTEPMEVQVTEPDLLEELPKLEGGITL